MLTLLAFSSAKFFEIISGEADSLMSVSFTMSSSTFDGFISQNILCLSNISFLTLLLDARIILFDIILIGVSRTSKTPTSIYLANKGFKTSNIPLVNENSLPKKLKENPQITCVVGLNTEPERLVDLRKNRMNSLKETENTKYTSIENIKKEIIAAKKTFQKYRWPSIDVTRKSVEETAASIIKIHEIYLNNAK